jgi:hypothetical protein
MMNALTGHRDSEVYYMGYYALSLAGEEECVLAHGKPFGVVLIPFFPPAFQHEEIVT